MRTNKSNTVFWFGLLAVFICLAQPLHAQFYTGSNHAFGKNRVQHQTFEWQYMNFPQFNVYYYGTGKDLADYSARKAHENLKELEKFFDYKLHGKVFLLVFNTLEDFRQSNIGLEEGVDQNIGGTIRIHGNKIFVYFEGDHQKLNLQIRKSIAEILFYQMGYGDNWREIIKNAALLSIPDWYAKGLTSFATEAWNENIHNAIKDAIATDKFKNLNRLEPEQAEKVGHALWYYISQVYGNEVIPNISYMSRVSRNIENGFLYVLGVPLPNLMLEAKEFYAKKFESEAKIYPLNDEFKVPLKTRKNQKHTRIAASPDRAMLAYTHNKLGQSRVFIYDLKKNKKKRIFRKGYKLDRIPNLNYPIIAWHPSGEMLAVVHEKNGEIFLDLYDTKEKKWNKRKFRTLEKVFDISFSGDGKTIAVSAMQNGQVDLFAYKLMTNSIEKLTNDVYDDIHPAFIEGTNLIVFSSNRPNDSIKNVSNPQLMQSNHDVFLLDYDNPKENLLQITSTPNINETRPFAFDSKNFSFLSNENGMLMRYKAYIDSAIARVDTAIHYRYFTRTEFISGYNRNIEYQSVHPKENMSYDLVFNKGRYAFYEHKLRDDLPNQVLIDQKEDIVKRKGKNKTPAESGIRVEEKPRIVVQQVIPIQKSTNDTGNIDINNYSFENEKNNEINIEKEKPISNSRFVQIKSPTDSTKTTAQDKEFKSPQPQVYHTAFIGNDLVTQADWNFANQIYQRFNGGPYIYPGMGMVLKLGISDIMEDYIVEGGARLTWNFNNIEYFVNFIDRKKRWDKKYSFQRLSQRQELNAFTLQRTIVQKGTVELKYPFSEVLSFRTTFIGRYDENIIQATDDRTLIEPNTRDWWVGNKIELVFDNTRSLGLNLNVGTRWKIFGETYQQINVANSDLYVVGLDYRKYIRIHRELIWANRVSASTSFGQRKLLYYMGSVDDWLLFGGEQFDFRQNIAQDQGYYFQTLASPMRGFIQNARNGNSFALINSEIRWPMFRYFIRKPISSDFLKTFQVIGFGDVGTAWTGSNPYSDDNQFNTREINTGGGSVVVRLQNKSDPIIGAFGLGARAKILGYFVRFDYAWGVEDLVVQDPRLFISLSLDF